KPTYEADAPTNAAKPSSSPVAAPSSEPASTMSTGTVHGSDATAIEDADDTKSLAPDASPLVPDVLLGSTAMTPQFGVLGRSGSQSVAIDLNGCNTISLFGVQGFGKSYTLGVIAEMASARNAGINVLPSP